MIGTQKFKRYVSELTSDSYGYIPVAYLRASAVHDLTLIKIIVARFVWTGNFLVRYFDSHTKWTYCQL